MIELVHKNCKCLSFTHIFCWQYKYQLNVEGTVAAYRFPYLMSSDSLVMKQDSIYYEYFYRDLLPWQHYIPLRSDLSDVLDQVKWAKEHDEEVRHVNLPIWLYPSKKFKVQFNICTLIPGYHNDKFYPFKFLPPYFAHIVQCFFNLMVVNFIWTSAL